MKPDIETTKIQLADSMVELLKRQPLSKISVKDICLNCSLSKRTFYNYFRDKNDLVSFIWEQLLERSLYSDGSPNGMQDYLNKITEYGSYFGDFFRKAYVYTGQNGLLETMYHTNIESLLNLIRANGWGDRIDNEVLQLLRFYVHGMLGYSREMVLRLTRQGADKNEQENFVYGARAVDFLPEKLKPLILTVNPESLPDENKS